MKYTKRIIHNLNRGYCCAELSYNGEKCILAASEKNDRCLLFDSKGNLKDVVWDSVGGTMSMAQIPGSNGHFIAIQKFYNPIESADAQLVYVYPNSGSWVVRQICSLPFVHRFAILSRDNRTFLLAACLKSGQTADNPWLEAGKMWAAEIPPLTQFSENCHLTMVPILEGLEKNHGFLKHMIDAYDAVDISCENGIFRIIPPSENSDSWQITRILNTPSSDLTYVDLDGDGVEELVSFSPFHGDRLCVYHLENGAYKNVFEQNDMPFLHAIWGGTLNSKRLAIVGYRNNNAALCALTCDDGIYHLEVIDKGCGPSNVDVFTIDGCQSIWAMNCETSEIALYTPM